MMEILAAVTGASITVAAVGLGNYGRRATESRDAVIRLTAAVENVATRLNILHTDMKSRDAEVFSRLRDLEAAVARMEGTQGSH